MDKYYFIEVQTYKSVNNMGLELGQYVFEKYNQVVVHSNCMYDIKYDIEIKMKELEEKYPKCKPFKFQTMFYKDRYGETFEEITVRPDSPYNDNLVFTTNVKVVRKLNLETSWI